MCRQKSIGHKADTRGVTHADYACKRTRCCFLLLAAHTHTGKS